MSCDFRKLAPNIKCSLNYKSVSGKFLLNDCIKETKTYLSAYNLLPKNNDNKKMPLEWELCLLRVGYYPDIKKFSYFDICATHKCRLGIYFLPSNVCEYPRHEEFSTSKSVFRHISYQQAIKIIEMNLNDPSIDIVTIGQALCRPCHDSFTKLIQKHVDSKNMIDQPE